MTAPFVEARGRRITLPAPATGAVMIGPAAFIPDVEGQVHIHRLDAERDPVSAHAGPILCAAPHPDGARLVTGGDDGRLCAVGVEGAAELAAFGRRWVEQVATSAASGAIVCGVAKEAIVFKAGGAEPSHRFTAPATVSGLAFDAKGRRLAISHYGGATLRYALMAEDAGVALKWAGAHIGVTLHPEASYVVTAMQDLQLHGWRVADKKDMRMAGYQAKTRAMSWDRRGRWLATSGADCAVIWPFQGKDGPMGKQPLMLGERAPLVTALAFHPSEDMLAIGYQDGCVVCARLPDGAAALIEGPGEGAVCGLSWSADGLTLAYADEAGRAGIVGLGG